MLIVRFRQTFRERSTEWVLSAMLALWGLFLFNSSPDLFNRPFYAPLAAVGVRGSWAAFATIIGSLRLVVLFINGAWRRTPMLRQIGAGCGMVVWIMLMMGTLSIDWRTPAVATYLGLFVLDALSLSYAARDAALVSQRVAGHGGG